jgi:hypothetical protein
MATKELLIAGRTYSKRQRKSDPNPEGILRPIEVEQSIYDDGSHSKTPEFDVLSSTDDWKFERVTKKKKKRRAVSFPPAKPKRNKREHSKKKEEAANTEAITQPPKKVKPLKREARGVNIGGYVVPPGMVLVPVQSAADDYSTDTIFEDY